MYNFARISTYSIFSAKLQIYEAALTLYLTGGLIGAVAFVSIDFLAIRIRGRERLPHARNYL
jgi:hypothetical protein